MLKISVTDGRNTRLLVLEGKLVAPWTDELTALVQSDSGDSKKRELVIDVSGITSISPDGEETLLSLIVKGAKFRGGGVYMRQVLQQLAQRLRENQHRK